MGESKKRAKGMSNFAADVIQYLQGAAEPVAGERKSAGAKKAPARWTSNSIVTEPE